MTIKPAICIALASLVGVRAAAQKSSFQVVETDPNKYKRTVLHIDPFNFLQYGMTKFTPTLKLETFIGERVMPSVQLRYTLFDMPWYDRQLGNLEPVGGHSAPMNLEAGLAFFAVNRTKNKQVKVYTYRSMGHMGMGSRTYHYVKVPSQVKRMFGFRGGVNSSRYLLAVNTEEAERLYTYHAVGSTQQYQVGASGSAGDFYAMANTLSAYGGLHFRKVTNTKLEFEDGRRRSNAFVTDFFVDVVYPVSSDISHVANQYDGEWVIKPKSTATVDFGWRCGFAQHSPRARILQYSLVFGQRPGYITTNDAGLYFLANIGFILGTDKYLGRKEPAVKEEKAQ